MKAYHILVNFACGLVFLTTAALAPATPPPWASAHGYDKANPKSAYTYQYRYYPDAAVYFDATRKLYFYLADEQWKQAATLPTDMQSRLTNFVLLGMETARPQEFYQDVMKVYSTSQTVTVAGSHEVIVAPVHIQTQPPMSLTTQTRSIEMVDKIIEAPRPEPTQIQQPHPAPAKQYQYLYYPNAQVYFDAGRAEYFYRFEGHKLRQRMNGDG